MRKIKHWAIILGLAFYSCSQNTDTIDSDDKTTDKSVGAENIADKGEVQNLIRQVLIWADSNKTIDLLPAVTDSTESFYSGFDLEKHKQNLEILKNTDFFATEFIENYNQIILTLDLGIRNGDYEKWYVGDFPTFGFANEANPWCICQDNLEWNAVDVHINSLTNDQGEMTWHWGDLDSDAYLSYKESGYKFRVIKESGRWKISYMQGFDLKEATEGSGEF